MQVLDAKHYKLPQQRKRALLRGLHRIFSPMEVPAPLPPFGSSDLISFLAKGLPKVRSTELTPSMRQNMKSFIQLITRAVRARESKEADPVVICLDRAKGKRYQQLFYSNRCPTLTTDNRYLYVLIPKELALPWEDRTMSRFLVPSERMGLQGKDPSIVALVPRRQLATLAAGNAYPVPLLCAVMAPMLRAIGNGGREREI